MIAQAFLAMAAQAAAIPDGADGALLLQSCHAAEGQDPTQGPLLFRTCIIAWRRTGFKVALTCVNIASIVLLGAIKAAADFWSNTTSQSIHQRVSIAVNGHRGLFLNLQGVCTNCNSATAGHVPTSVGLLRVLHGGLQSHAGRTARRGGAH